jgi:hypothetical protein
VENYSHQHDNGNSLDHTSIDIDLFNTNLPEELKESLRLIERKSFSVIWSFGENSMRLYRDGRQIFESSQEVHKRGGLKIE